MPDNDQQSLPETQPHPPPDFDTDRFEPVTQPADGGPEAEDDSSTVGTAPSEPLPAPVRSVTVPGQYYYLKWWQLVLVLLGVWVAAGAIGLGLFYWWYYSVDKTPAVFVVFVYVVVCTVGGLMLAMVPNRPLVSAVAIAVMSALFASVAATAPLYGYYYCQRVSPCLVGIIPY